MHTQRQLIVLLALAALVACAPKPKPAPAPAPEPVQAAALESAPVYVELVDDGLDTSERTARAINYLQIGDAESARADLDRVLAEDPGNNRARFLREQIDNDPTAYLGYEHFQYRVQSGDSLSLISKRFLGNPLKFYSLARYNGITNPSVLEVGQSLKIPGQRPTSVSTAALPDNAPVQPEPLPPPDALPESSQDQVTESSPSLVTAPATDPVTTEEVTVEVVETQPIAALEPPATINVPEEATATASPAPGEADSLFQRGMEEKNAGNLERANELFASALQIDPNHPGATQEGLLTRTALVNGYHREAMLLYRQQKLDEAIAIWDRVLVLEPDHPQASIRRANAITLREKVKTY